MTSSDPTPPTPKLRAGVAATETEDGMVLLDERTGRYWQLNATGAFVLQTLLAGGTCQDAAAALAERYPSEAERAATDVTAFTERLLAAGLLTFEQSRRNH
jgi:hypothetical protein